MVQFSGEGSKLSKLNALDVLGEASCDGFSTPRRGSQKSTSMVSPFVVPAWFVSGGAFVWVPNKQTNKQTNRKIARSDAGKHQGRIKMYPLSSL